MLILEESDVATVASHTTHLLFDSVRRKRIFLCVNYSQKDPFSPDRHLINNLLRFDPGLLKSAFYATVLLRRNARTEHGFGSHILGLHGRTPTFR